MTRTLVQSGPNHCRIGWREGELAPKAHALMIRAVQVQWLGLSMLSYGRALAVHSVCQEMVRRLHDVVWTGEAQT